jgi:hypothetical protein
MNILVKKQNEEAEKVPVCSAKLIFSCGEQGKIYRPNPFPNSKQDVHRECR